MNLFGKKSRAGLRVEIVIQGMLAGRYVSVVEVVEVPEGADVRAALKRLHAQGTLDDEAYAVLRGVPTPLTLLVNGDHVGGRGREKRALAAGDHVTILVPVSGG